MGKLPTESLKDVDFLDKNSLIQTIKSVGWAFLLSFFGVTVGAFLFTYTSLQEKHQSTSVYVIMAISVFIASWINGKKACRRGWLNGGLTGIIYVLIILAISSLISKGVSVNITLLTHGIISVTSGVIGGIFGVNMKK